MLDLPSAPPHLEDLFAEINLAHFDGFLDLPVLRWNSRLRSSAGRFVPGARRYFHEIPAAIEIALYLVDEKDSRALIIDTLAHEMIHYWLWVLKRPFGHTPEFHQKMNQMGVSRYNTVPKRRPHRYAYRCPVCSVEFLARRKLGTLACAKCCKQHAGGRYDPRFKLVFERNLS